MKQIIETVMFALTDKQLLEMANMQPAETGLSAIVHVCYKGGAKHGARVKVSNIAGRFHPTDNFSVTLEPTPRVIGNCKLKGTQLSDIKRWVMLNRHFLIQIWEHGDTMRASDIERGLHKISK